ncbi:hypothetical protein [Segniliparus rotundus]|uniref:hypothetical protein n=1 Tax=Segniliparus rotundus TaxID=286802 RepID=UPI0011D07BAA|nr:hypothetical protein [Segniliparus rotundus]
MRVIKGRGKEIISAIDSFVLAIPNKESGQVWNWGDEKISQAADHMKQVVDESAPKLDAYVGSGAPKDLSDAVHNFVKVAKEFADAADRRADADEINPLNKEFTDAVNRNKEVCHF